MYKKIKPTLAIVSSLFLAFFLVKNGGGIIEVAHAEVPLNAELDTVLKDLQGKWSLFIQLGVYLSFLLYPYVIVLLNPQFFLEITASSGNGLSQNPILTIWQLSRDIMNTIFAFMLIAGAMVTVITAKQDYLKKYAIKFFLGIILVNFSWFFPRVILDVSHVLTANIYQIPSIIGTECKVRNASGKMIDCIYPTSVRFFQNDTFKDTGDYTCPNPYVCYIPSTLDNNTNISSGILAGLIMNHARLPELDKVMASSNSTNSQNNLGWIKSLIESIIRSGMQLLIVIYITLIMIGMTIALLIRVPILWMTMGFMPLMFLGFVIGDLMPKFNTMEIFKHFVKAAFLPAVLAMPLSIGYIIINALAFSPAPPSAAILENSTGPLLAGVNDLWQFLWLLLTVVVMW
ncbi:MAG: hypothetical protein KAS32_30415, partial [Candidatus Peribacteraceae bacterium]|nr:hypothetical protein [Candidatus Peribacteraceae bacterium]